MNFFKEKTIIYGAVFFCLAFPFSLKSAEEKPYDIDYWYLTWMQIPLFADFLNDVNCPSDTSISTSSAKKVFKNKLTRILDPKIDFYKKHPESIPKEVVIRKSDSYEKHFLSWYMPKSKWKMVLETPRQKGFQWANWGFPVLWQKDSHGGKRFVLFFLNGSEVKSITDDDFAKLQKKAVYWLSPEKHNIEEIYKSLEKGNRQEKLFAMKLLVLKKDKKSLPLILPKISDKDFHNMCILAIKEMGNKDDIPVLIKAFYLPFANIPEIIVTMCSIGGKQVNKELNTWLSDPELSRGVKDKIKQGILQANYKPAIAIFLPSLRSSNKNQREEAGWILKQLGYFPKRKGVFEKKVTTPDGFVVSLILDKNKFKPMEKILVKLRFVNNTDSTIILRRNGYNPIINFKTLQNGGIVPYTRYGEKRKNPNSLFGPRGGMPVVIKPSKFFETAICISKLFDLSLSADYLLSFDINFFIALKNKKEKKSIKINNIPFSIQ